MAVSLTSWSTAFLILTFPTWKCLRRLGERSIDTCRRLFNSKGGKSSTESPPEVDASDEDIAATDLTFVMTKLDGVLSETLGVQSVGCGRSNWKSSLTLTSHAIFTP